MVPLHMRSSITANHIAGEPTFDAYFLVGLDQDIFSIAVLRNRCFSISVAFLELMRCRNGIPCPAEINSNPQTKSPQKYLVLNLCRPASLSK
mmetsp:Transcript_51128/g.153628  ORF Transcript_51128/g.153628 Transcript_51128/m.153628 type:complete len:92 (-) Transcript_51128:1518-1793(-)